MSSIDDDYKRDSYDAGPDIDLLADISEHVEGQEGEHVATQDTAVWCEQCGIHNIGDCFIHGGNMTITPDNAMPTRACLSLPKILTLKRVRDSEPCSLEAKRGVFSRKFMKLRTLFGPMEAKRMSKKPKLQTGMMEYQLQTSGKSECEYLDISDENSCNWMMFVRPANVFAQQNMAAFQDRGNIYFVTCKNIPKGTELRVWYAAAYAKAIGKRILLPDPADRKQTFPDVKKEKKSLHEQPHNNMTTSVASNREPMKNPSENCNIKSTSDYKMKGASHNEKSTTTTPKKIPRRVRATKDSSVLFACNTCNTAFSKLGQLDLHICKELGEGEEDNSGCVTRRRKGKPRKLDSEDNSSTSKVAKMDVHSQEICLDTNSSKMHHPDIISHLDGEDISAGDCGNSGADSGITLLPSTALIPTTTTEFSGDDGENQPSSTNKRGPGRPKGSKNKSRVFTKVKLHVKTETPVSKRQIYNCQYCEKTFTSNELFVIHEASHTNSLPYTCDYPECGKSFTSKFKHQRHLAVHKKPNNFPCKFCSSTFNRVDHLKNHLLVHDSNRSTFTCTVCGKSYLYKTNLTFHMAKHEAEEGSTLHCLVCNTKFESKELLKVHVNTHNRYKKEVERMRKHSCSQCHKLFTSSKDIKRHMVTHSKERHFLCEHCPQTFVRKDHLRRHYTSNHKKEFYESQLKDSPYGCSICLLVFKQKDFLDYHMKSAHAEGMTAAESRPRKEKPGRLLGKLSVGSDSNDGNPPPCAARVSKDSQNQLVKLLQKQPVQKPQLPRQQLAQFTTEAHQPLSALQQQSDSLPMKVQQGSNQTNNPRPYAIVYPAPMQSTSSQTSLYDSNEMIVESFTAQPTKTIPFRFQNQLVSQQQLQGQNNSQVHLLQQDNQQQQIQQDQASLLNQIQMQQQAQQQQFHQQQLQQQIQQQSVAPMVQGMQVDILNSLAGLSQVQEMPGNSNTNFVNIINLGGHNFIVRPGQVLDLNKPVQLTVIKDSQLDNKQSSQHHTQSHMQHLGVKSDSSNLVYSNTQVMRGNICKPDHCYASAIHTNSTLSHILNNQNKTQLPVLDKSNSVQGPSLTNEEATQIMTQIKNAGSSVVLGSNLPETMPAQNELLGTHQQQHLQQLHQDHHFQQQENQQQDQQQPMQNMSGFTLAWSDSLQDYSSIGELPVSTDVTSINHGDVLGTVVSSSMPSNWILQLPASMLDQSQAQQLQGHHLTDSQVMSVTTSGTLNEN